MSKLTEEELAAFYESTETLTAYANCIPTLDDAELDELVYYFD